MMIPVTPPGMNTEDGAAGLEQLISNAADLPLTGFREASTATVLALAYAEFAAAVKDALRDGHSPDLLARNPLLRAGIGNLDGAAGARELKALLSDTVNTLFGNPRDEKLRRVIQPIANRA
jgi:hypothetical protein